MVNRYALHWVMMGVKNSDLVLISKFFLSIEVANDPVAETDLVKWYWEPVIQQKMGLVCYKTGSDEIVGVNMNFVACKDDHFYDDMQRHVMNLMKRYKRRFIFSKIFFQFKSEKNHRQFATLGLLNENFDSCKHYGVDKYLSSAGLVVIPECRGRGIGEQFLKCRESICKEFGIKLTSTSFTSEFSNRVADRAGFKVDVVLRYHISMVL